MNTLIKLLFTITIVGFFNEIAFAEGKLEGEALRKNVIKRLPELNHTKLEALMKRVGKKTPKNLYNCLCRQDGGGAAMGVGVSYHPESLKPYTEKWMCHHSGPPCMAQGNGCWRFPLPNDSEITNYCIEKATYDDGTTIVDAIVGAVDSLHVEENKIYHTSTSEYTKIEPQAKTIVDKTFAECPTQDCWIQEAQDQLRQVLSDPQISTEERIKIVKKSAKTLKEYGQPSAFPKGDIALKTLMLNNYKESRKQLEGINDLRKIFNDSLLKQKLKLINEIQIEVVGEQISFLIPGATTFSMSKNLIQTVFDWDIVGGVNSGRYGTAISLTNKFKELAKTKKLIEYFDELYNVSRLSTKKLFNDKNNVISLEDELRAIYQTTENNTRVRE